MHIAIITPDYPYNGSHSYTFVQQIAEAMADMGNEISIIIPRSATKHYLKCKKIWPFISIEKTINGNSLRVYRLRILTLGNLKIGKYSLNDLIISKAISHTLEKIHSKQSINVIYGHFWRSAYSSRLFAKKYNIPLFLANGESYLPPCNYNDDFFKMLNGVICVSSKCKLESIKAGYLRRETPCVVIPNAIDARKFYKMDKVDMRRRMGYNEEDFIVVFTGHFIERKGANRVSCAIDLINDKSVKAIFLGTYVDADKSFGPSCDGILYQGGCIHDDVAKYLSCADVFCLPTLNEGCCNAIVEAMACGLPIISSNLSFNWDILNSHNSILIDPTNVREIAKAIILLKDNNELREQLSQSSLEKAKELNIENRATQIISFINKNI